MSDTTVATKPELLSQPGFRIWVAAVLGTFAIFSFQGEYQSLIGPLSNILPATTAASSFGGALLCFLRYGRGLRRRFEFVWLFFALGMGLWVAAEVTWAIYYFVLAVEVPYPSIADVFYIGGYFPILAALALYLGAFSAAMTRRRLAIAMALIAVAVTVGLAFVVPVELASETSILNALTDLIYPILDLGLLSLTILALSIFFGGSIGKWWLLLGVGSLLYVIGDEFFLYQFAIGAYYNGSFDDLIFVMGYLTFALAFYVHLKEF